VANGRKKKHHAHELGDPYAEGWIAREVWNGLMEKPVNPYPLFKEIAPSKGESVENVAKREAGYETRRVEAEQWARGWADWEEDFEKDDLDEVVPADFRNLGIRRPPPRREGDYD
jgi:hypothetical protein